MLIVEFLLVVALIGAEAAAEPPPVVQALYLGPRILDMRGEVDAEVQERVFRFAEQGLINGIVLDIKHEDGRVLSLAATERARRYGAVKGQAGAGVIEFLEEARRRGIWLIGRVTAFKDIVAYHHVEPHQRLSREDCDWRTCWLAPHSRSAREYVIEIATAAAPYFDEIMFDYVRYPDDHIFASASRREAAVTAFAREACAAIREVGAQVSFAVFAGVAVWRGEQGIGQTATMPGCADTVSPMVYPSHEGVERLGVDRLVAAAAERWGGHRLRPWYEFHNHGRQISSGEPYAEAGWLIWDPKGYALEQW